MVETIFQSASNEVNTMASDSLEDGEVPQIVIPINGDDLVALQTQLLISSAGQLGFTSAQIEAFLHPRPIEPNTTPQPKVKITVALYRMYTYVYSGIPLKTSNITVCLK